MLTFLLDDVGIPKNYTTMNGAGVHTYVMINRDGKETYVKFHWIAEQGEHNLLDDDAAVVCGKDFSHATHQLIDSIAAGRYPAWRLMIQTMDPATELHHSWGDPLDPTKTWPEDRFPMQEVGRMVLNQNMDNHFLEGEQIAFSPGNIIPGITYSNDKLLQGRIFSYADTQRYRIGSNYLQLPVNAPRCPFMNRQYDGALNFMHRSSEVNYFPSVTQAANGKNHNLAPERVPVPSAAIKGVQMRHALPNENNFIQPGERWRSFDNERRQRFVQRVADTLNAPRVSKQLKTTWISYWTKCDRELGSRIAQLVKSSSM